MQAVGILFLTFAVWLIYSGLSSFRPIATLLAIVKDPANAGTIVEGAKDAAQKTKATITDDTTTGVGGVQVSGTTVTIGVNPFASYTVTAPYGQRNHGPLGDVHEGIDYGMPQGTPLPSIIEGTFSTSTGSAGGNIAIVTGTGRFAGWTVYYDHTSKFTASKGDKVTIGQTIAQSGGKVGSEGAGDATGPHLHLEIHHLGAIVDPASFFTWEQANKSNLAAQTATTQSGTFSSPSSSNPFLNGAN